MTKITTYLSILTLNVNRLTPPSKDNIWQTGLKRKIRQSVYCLQETNLIDRNKLWLRVKGWKTVYQANGPRKQVRVAALTLDKTDIDQMR
jgi:hypothetical protein